MVRKQLCGLIGYIISGNLALAIPFYMYFLGIYELLYHRHLF